MALGEQIQNALEAETQPPEQLRVVRARLLEQVTGPRRRPRHTTAVRVRYAAVGIVGALVAIGAIIAHAWSRPISFVTDAGERGPGDVLEAAETGPLRVDFSEGSRLLLHEGARARVLEAGTAGARVLLESGAADVSIAHRSGRAARWRFEAGPFQVVVRGTQFELGWQPSAQVLSLTMRAGKVELSGPCLPRPRQLERGASLRLSCPQQAAPRTAASTVRTQATPTPPAITPPRADPATPAVSAESAPKTALQRFEASCDVASRPDLVAWASRERLAGRVARARVALLALRRRFPGSSEAGTAAFTLGRMAFDQQADYAEAARWFASYLAERPRGALMGDAAGRLLEAYERQGDRVAARRHAKVYLQRFPDGPYAQRARRLLAE